MKRKSLLFLLLFALLAPWVAQAQTRATLTFDFEDQTIPSTWTNDATYPWVVTNASANAGTYSIKSGNSGVNSTTSTITATYTFAGDGSISFAVRCSSEQTNPSYDWDYGTFYIDGVQQGSKIINSTTFSTLSYDVEVGEHTFMWKYKKDSSVGSNDDCLYVDDIVIDLGVAASTPKPTGLAVSEVTDNSAKLSWTENGTATSWQLCINGDEDNPTTINTNPYTLTNLTATTAYTVKVRSVGNGEYSAWSNEVSFSTTAVAVAVGDAWSDDFEGETCGWELINGTITNAWAWGTAASNGGTHGLYISNDGGTTNAYSVGNAAMVYATKLLNFTEGKFEFSYNWMANGEGSGSYVYDYLRVALVPSSVTLTAGTSVPSGFSASALPAGWIAVDGGSYLNGVTTWQSQSVAVNVPAGNYYLVMAWRDDTSSGSQPPAAVDNVSITKVTCDQDVTNLAVNNITTTGATLSWEGGEATQWQVAYSTTNSFEGATEEIVDAATYTMSGLNPSTVYYAKVRAYCGGEDFGSWCNPISFPTACEALTEFPYTENFDSYTGTTSGSVNNLPVCWNYINGSNYSYYAGYPVIYNSSSNSHSGNNHLYFYSYYSSSYTYSPLYAVLPAMENLEGKELTLYAKAYNASSSFKVGMMTDPNDINTFVEIGSKTPSTSTYEECTFILGQGNHVAIMMEAANSSSTYRGIRIDDITIDFAPTCAKPINLTASNLTNHSATLKWNAGSEDQDAWEIAYKKGETFNPNDPALDWTTITVISVTDTAYIFNKTLDAASTYYAYVRANCGESDNSKWSTVCSFTTKAAALKPTNFQKKDVGPDYAKLTWKAGGGDFETAWELYYVASSTTPTAPTAETEPTTTVTTLPTDENPYVLEGLENETRYYIWVRADHGTDGKSAWTALSGSYFTTLVACPTPTNLTSTNVTPSTATLNWAGYSESYNVHYRTAAGEDAPFMQNFEISLGNWTFTSMNVINGIGGDAYYPAGITSDKVHGGSKSFRFSSYGQMEEGESYDQYLVSPALTETGNLKYYAWQYGTNDHLYLGVSTTTNDLDAFSWEEISFTSTQSWLEFTKELSEDVKFFAFHYYGNYAYYIYVDDITINAYEIPAGEWNYANNIEDITTTIQNLSDGTEYEWQVQPTCAVDPENPENGWTASAYFTTPDVCTAPFALDTVAVASNSATLKWTGYQENYNVRYRTPTMSRIYVQTGMSSSNYSFTGWTQSNEGEDSGLYYLDSDHTVVGYIFVDDETVTGSQYFISPEMEPTDNATLEFFGGSFDEATEYLNIGFSSTDNDVASFTWYSEEPMTIATQEYFEFEVPDGTKYIAFQYTPGEAEEPALFVTDITVYALTPASEWEYAYNVTSPATIDGLNAETWYEWQVQGNLEGCGENDATDWTASKYFQTHKKTTETQTVQLIAGANWFSTYLEIERTDLEAALLAVLPTATNIVIQSQGGTDRYNGTRWRTTGGFTWNVTQMYMINVPEDCEITLTGMPINPEEKPITITANAANWIGFPFSESVGYEVALGTDFQPANGDVIQSPTSSLRYVSTRWRATNGFTNFEPGKGYIFNSKATYDRTLIFQNGSKSVQRARKELPFGNIQPITKTMFKLSKTGKVSSNELATKRKRQ